jgi:hypothetical protein
MVLSGDSPHYLVAANSLVEDWDFDLRNNYDQALAGDWDMGARFRERETDRHVDTDSLGRQYGVHSPFFALLLLPAALPFAGTQWMEAVCVWLTLGAGLAGIWLYGEWLRRRQLTKHQVTTSLFLLALATPLLCYSRDVWTETWILLIWMAMLLSTHLGVLSLLGFLGTLIKYPFAVVPVVMGLVALHRREKARALAMIGSAGAGILAAIGTIQWIFQDVEHFSLFHSGRHRGFDLPFDGMVGLLLSPETGLLLFFPFLAWGLWRLPKEREIYLPAIAFFLVHASYQGWAGGTGFSARYLLPLLPIVTAGIAGSNRNTILFRIAVLYGVFWGLFGGVFPAFVYDRSPWGVCLHIWKNLWG